MIQGRAVPRELDLAEKGLQAALVRIVAATSEDDALCSLSECLFWVYGLEEWWCNTMTSSRYYSERDSRPDGELVGGLVWARNFAQHELGRTADLGDRYSDFYTAMYGVLEWRTRSNLPAKGADDHHRDLSYDKHLAEHIVPDTIATAQEFFGHLRQSSRREPGWQPSS